MTDKKEMTRDELVAENEALRGRVSELEGKVAELEEELRNTIRSAMDTASELNRELMFEEERRMDAERRSTCGGW